MASASSSDLCSSCLNKYNRNQLSLCQCKHCSQSFCFDCMKQHRDEMEQDYEELANRCNEAKQIIEMKKALIANETNHAKRQLNEWLYNYIKNLTAEKTKIDVEIDDENKRAQVPHPTYVLRMLFICFILGIRIGT